MKLSTNFLLSLFILMINAEPVLSQSLSDNAAWEKALDFFLTQVPNSQNYSRKSPRMAPKLAIAQKRPEFIIFNDNTNGGYVIISGDEQMPDILGYSYTGSFDANNVPINMQCWLEGYAKQVQYLQTHRSTDIKRQGMVKGRAIPPLLTCNFDQEEPYWNKCPLEGSLHTYNGCVATALAQVMYYHKWPQDTIKLIPGYVTESKKYVLSDIENVKIDWDNILPSYRPKKYNSTQGDAIAKLMLICGTAIETDYNELDWQRSYIGSGAYFGNCCKALLTYFDYYDDIAMLFADEYESAQWNQIIYDELNANRPVLYSGQPTDDFGHAFVIDGYDKDDYFHVNWGWGSFMDGYFLLTALPKYKSNQEAIVGIRPSDPNVPKAYATLDEGILTFYYDFEQDKRKGTIYANMNSGDIGRLGGIYRSYSKRAKEISKCVIDESYAQLRPRSLSSLFEDCSNLKEIQGLENLNMSNVEDFRHMFYGCSSLKSIDISSLNSERLIATSGMFGGCSSLTNLNLSHLNTSNVRYMSSMFSGCSSLRTLDISHLNTSNVRDMSSMFSGCSSLRTLDISHLNTSNVVIMMGMFGGCSSLKTLDINHLNTSNVVDMMGMFGGCSSLESLDLSNFKTQKVQSMRYMFKGCSSLKGLDLTNFDTDNVVDMSEMFANCHALEKIEANFNCPNVKNMDHLFRFCESLETMNLGMFSNTINLTSTEGMFSSCTHLKVVDFNSFYTGNVTSMEDMFNGCTSLQMLDLNSLNTANLTNMNSMFYHCRLLKDLNISKLNTENVETMNQMFTGCNKLTSIDLSGFKTNKTTDVGKMFSVCPALKTIYVGGGWNLENVTNSVSMFSACNAIVGGEGTNYNPSFTDASYAHIDEGSVNPGYLTYKESPASYKLIYLVDGEVYKTSSVCCNVNISPIPVPEKEGYSFSGWSDMPTKMPEHDVTVHGTFSVNKYVVRYYVGGKLYAEDEVEYGDNVVLRDYYPEDASRYRFEGWFGTNYKTMPAHDIEYHAEIHDEVVGVRNTLSYIEAIYDAKGRKLIKPQLGINILLMSDGSKKKLIIK